MTEDIEVLELKEKIDSLESEIACLAEDVMECACDGLRSRSGYIEEQSIIPIMLQEKAYHSVLTTPIKAIQSNGTNYVQILENVIKNVLLDGNIIIQCARQQTNTSKAVAFIALDKEKRHYGN